MSNNTPRTTYLVTGAGTIGLAYVRYLIQSTPRRVVVVDRSESAVATLLSYQRSLEVPDADRLRVLWADLSDPLSLETLKDEVIHVVVHTAATKHFSLGEAYPDATYQSNMQSFETVWNWAEKDEQKKHLQKFVFTSTDKVTGQSTNSMIRAKQDIEKIVQSTSDMPGIIVRFGNVLDSSDSLLPVLRACARERRTFTLHHTDMTRYLVSGDEAVQIVHHAVTNGRVQSIVSKIPVATKVLDLVSAARGVLKLESIKLGDSIGSEHLHEALYTQEETIHTRIDTNGFLEHHPDLVGNLSPEQILAVTSSRNCLLSVEQVREILGNLL